MKYRYDRQEFYNAHPFYATGTEAIYEYHYNADAEGYGTVVELTIPYDLIIYCYGNHNDPRDAYKAITESHSCKEYTILLGGDDGESIDSWWGEAKMSHKFDTIEETMAFMYGVAIAMKGGKWF